MQAIEGIEIENMQQNITGFAEIVNNFLRDGALWRDENGIPRLNRELQGVFTVVNNPAKTLRFDPLSQDPFNLHYYSFIGDKGVLMSISNDESTYTLGYPITKPMLSTWLFDEIIGELGVQKTHRESIDWHLNHQEFDLLTLLMISNNYWSYMGRPGYPVIEQLMDESMLHYINNQNVVRMKPETVQLVTNMDFIKQQLPQLEEKGVVKVENNQVILHPTLANGLKEGQIRNIVEIGEITPFKRGKLFYITNHGYIIIEPLLKMPMEWRISVEGLEAFPYHLLTKLLDFGPIDPGPTLTEELRKRHPEAYAKRDQ